MDKSLCLEKEMQQYAAYLRQVGFLLKIGRSEMPIDVLDTLESSLATTLAMQQIQLDEYIEHIDYESCALPL